MSVNKYVKKVRTFLIVCGDFLQNEAKTCNYLKNICFFLIYRSPYTFQKFDIKIGNTLYIAMSIKFNEIKDKPVNNFKGTNNVSIIYLMILIKD